MNKVIDERHLSYFDVFKFTSGQVNISKAYPGTIVAWHRHQNQWDEWFVVDGILKVGIKTKNGVEFKIMGPGDYLWIKNNTWHGYMALTETTLIYYVSARYNPDKPDEERLFQEFLREKGLSVEDYMASNPCTKDVMRFHFRTWLFERKSRRK